MKISSCKIWCVVCALPSCEFELNCCCSSQSKFQCLSCKPKSCMFLEHNCQVFIAKCQIFIVICCWNPTIANKVLTFHIHGVYPQGQSLESHICVHAFLCDAVSFNYIGQQSSSAQQNGCTLICLRLNQCKSISGTWANRQSKQARLGPIH